jgi:hypothetical protein
VKRLFRGHAIACPRPTLQLGGDLGVK